MFSRYIHYLLEKAVYEKDESGYIVASVPGYSSFFSQWETIEEARENLMDAIEGVVFHKIQHNDQQLIEEIKSFISPKHVTYA